MWAESVRQGPRAAPSITARPTLLCLRREAGACSPISESFAQSLTAYSLTAYLVQSSVRHHVGLNSKSLIPLANSQRVSLFPRCTHAIETLRFLTSLVMISDALSFEMGILVTFSLIGVF